MELVYIYIMFMLTLGQGCGGGGDGLQTCIAPIASQIQYTQTSFIAK